MCSFFRSVRKIAYKIGSYRLPTHRRGVHRNFVYFVLSFFKSKFRPYVHNCDRYALRAYHTESHNLFMDFFENTIEKRLNNYYHNVFSTLFLHFIIMRNLEKEISFQDTKNYPYFPVSEIGIYIYGYLIFYQAFLGTIFNKVRN